MHDLLGPTASKKTSKRKQTIHSPVDYRADIVWTGEHNEAFELLKEKLTTAPVLAYPDFKKPFIVETDASLKGLGAVLMQRDEENNVVKVIAYASRSLWPSEKSMKNYSSAKLELLALKWAVTEKFRDYLLGSKFTVVTDNNPLAYVNKSKLGAAQICWMSDLALFDFDIKYRSGSENRVADALSHRPSNPCEEDVEEEYEVLSYDVVCQTLNDHTDSTKFCHDLRYAMQEEVLTGNVRVDQIHVECNDISVLPEISAEEMRFQQLQDPNLVDVIKQIESQTRLPFKEIRKRSSKVMRKLLLQYDKLVIKNGVLCRVIVDEGSEYLQLVLPNNLQYRVFVSVHEGAGHQGFERTLALVKERCYWPSMASDIENWMKHCNQCLVTKAPYAGIKVKQGTIIAKNPMELVCVDFTKMDPSARGDENVLVITDAFSKFTQCVVTPNQKALTVAKALVDKWFIPYKCACQVA